ncbi:hypothetical protein DPSP01_009572 [Paraphaeosphaeria sporulosa]
MIVNTERHDIIHRQYFSNQHFLELAGRLGQFPERYTSPELDNITGVLRVTQSCNSPLHLLANQNCYSVTNASMRAKSRHTANRNHPQSSTRSPDPSDAQALTEGRAEESAALIFPVFHNSTCLPIARISHGDALNHSNAVLLQFPTARPVDRDISITSYPGL